MSAARLALLALALGGTAYALLGPAGTLAPALAALPEPAAATGTLGAPIARLDAAAWAESCRAADVPDIALPADAELEPVRRLVAESRAWTQRRDGDALGRMGEIALAIELHEAALDLFHAAAELGTQRARWLYLAGVEHQQLGRLEAAVKSLRAAVALDPTVGVARARVGRALFELGSHEEARLEFEACLRAPATTALGHIGLARLALVRQEFEPALAQLDAAAKLTPSDYVIWQLRAQALASLGRAGESERDAARARQLPRYRGWLSFDPTLREAAERARTYTYLENQLGVAQARRDMAQYAAYADELTARLPGNAEVWRRAATAQWANKDIPAARVRLERALAADPRSVPTLCSAAEIEINAGGHAQALAYATRAVEADPASAFAHEVLGRASIVNGRAGDAVVHARRAVELAPEDKDNRQVLIEILIAVGRGDEARLELEALLAREPSNAWAKERLGALGTGR